MHEKHGEVGAVAVNLKADLCVDVRHTGMFSDGIDTRQGEGIRIDLDDFGPGQITATCSSSSRCWARCASAI